MKSFYYSYSSPNFSYLRLSKKRRRDLWYILVYILQRSYCGSYCVFRFLIVIETYDVLITIPQKGSYEFRITSQDNSGYASLWLGEEKKNYTSSIPDPNLYYIKIMRKVTLSTLLALRPEDIMRMSKSSIYTGKFDQPGIIDGKMKKHTLRPLQNG